MGYLLTNTALELLPLRQQVYCNRVLDFFPVNNFVHRAHWTHCTGGTSAHNEFKFGSVSCTLSLVVTNRVFCFFGLLSVCLFLSA